MGDRALEGAAALLHVALFAAQQAQVGLGPDEDLQVEQVGQLGIGEDQDALGDDDRGGPDL